MESSAKVPSVRMAGSPRKTSRSAVAVGALVLAFSIVLAATVLGGAAAQQAQPETDNTVTRIDVQADGSARWTVQIRTRLDSAARVEEYQAFQDRFRKGSAQYLAVFRDRMRGVVANAENVTGREMHAVDFVASTSIQEVPRRWGVVSYEFTWEGFADAANGSVDVGDVFEGGFFIAENDTLQIDAPDGYAIQTVEPEPASRDNGVVSWTGRVDFADRHPRVVFVTGSGAGQGSTAGWIGGDGSWWLLLAVAALLTAVGVAFAWRRRSGAEPAVAVESAPPGSGTATADASVLTDEERVRRLLEANDGRVRQAAVAEELDWSASKTSRVVGDMVEDGTVEKLQLGRENLLELAEDG